MLPPPPIQPSYSLLTPCKLHGKLLNLWFCDTLQIARKMVKPIVLWHALFCTASDLWFLDTLQIARQVHGETYGFVTTCKLHEKLWKLWFWDTLQIAPKIMNSMVLWHPANWTESGEIYCFVTPFKLHGKWWNLWFCDTPPLVHSKWWNLWEYNTIVLKDNV